MLSHGLKMHDIEASAVFGEHTSDPIPRLVNRPNRYEADIGVRHCSSHAKD
jgi:hypothetical protein